MNISEYDIFSIIAAALFITAIIVAVKIIHTTNYRRKRKEYNAMEDEELALFGIDTLYIPDKDDTVIVKSRQTLINYDCYRYLRENREMLSEILETTIEKEELGAGIALFLQHNNLKNCESKYKKFFLHSVTVAKNSIRNSAGYRILVRYISSANNLLGEKTLVIPKIMLERLQQNPTPLMTRAEIAKLEKTQNAAILEQKRAEYYDKLNGIATLASQNREQLLCEEQKEKLDNVFGDVFTKTAESIRKAKSPAEAEWRTIDYNLDVLNSSVSEIVSLNERLLDYYSSYEFLRLVNTVSSLIDSQTEFNQYIEKKIEAISTLFGCLVVRNETTFEDSYDYIRPYKKTLTPFTAEVSNAVFSSAENQPMEYIVKYFYPNRNLYPEQIEKLYLLIEEIETLKEAKEIINRHKENYRSYLQNVPSFVLDNDEAGFFRRLGFADIRESTLTVNYEFSYTSNGGFARRSFSVPMTEKNIAELIRMLENKLSSAGFVKEQRRMMTKKLREEIKKRDNYTCRYCGNSIFKEPNLLLEIDHIVPVSNGGTTEKRNLQTLCWKCNRQKGAKAEFEMILDMDAFC